MAKTFDLIKVSEKEMDKDGIHYYGAKYEIGIYNVEHFVTTYENGYEHETIYVRSAIDDRYVPEIYFYDDWFGDKIKRFEIETTAYGSLKVDEIETMVGYYKEAIETVKVLTKKFC